MSKLINATTIMETFDPPWKWTSFKAILFSLYAIIFVLASIGNYLVVFVVIRKKSMQTITNIFITNLALSDILTTLVAIPFTPIAVYIDEWIFPAILCKLFPMTMGLSVYVSTLTSTAIAVDRYIVIVHPFVPRMKMKICIVIICLIWILGILFTLPLALFKEKIFDKTTNKTECREVWHTSTSREIYTLVNFIFQFVLPCLIISLCYYFVGKVHKVRFANRIGCGNKTREREEVEIKRRRRTNQMLIAMVIVFIICWTPLNALWIISELLTKINIYIMDEIHFYTIFLSTHLIAMSGTMYNPFIYGWMNKNFRHEFQKVLPCLNISSDISSKSFADNTNYRRGTELFNGLPNQICSLKNRTTEETTDICKSPLLPIAGGCYFTENFKVSSL